MTAQRPKTSSARLTWLDIARGLAILWVVYFHLVTTYKSFPSPIGAHFLDEVIGNHALEGFTQYVRTFFKIIGFSLSGMGFHAVGVFLIISGFVLYQSTQRKPLDSWSSCAQWYKQKLFRLYPMYWMAHLVYLISPFMARPEPIDGRFWLSLTGFRFLDIYSSFFYLNPAWWFFTMLIQLYFLFPLLFLIVRRLGMNAAFILFLIVGFLIRYDFMIWHPKDGMWVQGGFGLCRLPEFALGMILGHWHLKNPDGWNKFLLNGRGLALGIVLYPAALWCYKNLTTYTFVDFTTSVCAFLLLVGLSGVLEKIAPWLVRGLILAGAFSYGIFLLHQPYIITLGEALRPYHWPVFLALAAIGITVVSVWGMIVEWATNYLVQKITRK